MKPKTDRSYLVIPWPYVQLSILGFQYLIWTSPVSNYTKERANSSRFQHGAGFAFENACDPSRILLCRMDARQLTGAAPFYLALISFAFQDPLVLAHVPNDEHAVLFHLYIAICLDTFRISSMKRSTRRMPALFQCSGGALSIPDRQDISRCQSLYRKQNLIYRTTRRPCFRMYRS